MPRNFPEMWERRVERNLSADVNAPFLAGIPELDTQVIELSRNSVSEMNIIHIPTTDFEVEVLVNNTSYPIALQEYTDNEVIIKLDKLQTKVVSLSDDQVIGASYDRIDAATSIMVDGMLIKKYRRAIHALAPEKHSLKTPVVPTGGPAVAGLKSATYEDLVALKGAMDDAGAPEEGRRLVLCSDHWNNLLLDRKNFGDQLVNYKTGQLAPVIAGFELYKYMGNPVFNEAGEKVPFDSLPAEGQHKASVAFVARNVAKKTGLTRQYYLDAGINPRGQTNELAYRHYFIAVPKQKQWIGALYSAKA